ncbi:Endo-1,4-beta-xylanase A precursor [compost metagenome]
MPAGEVTRAEFVQMLVQVFGLEDTTAKADFRDVEAGAWYYPAIASARKLGLVEGREDGSFGVNARINREDMAVLAYRASKLLGMTAPDTRGSSAAFADQSQISDYVAEAIAALRKAGVMDGLSGGYFEPKSSSTRAQAAVLLYRLYQANP